MPESAVGSDATGSTKCWSLIGIPDHDHVHGGRWLGPLGRGCRWPGERRNFSFKNLIHQSAATSCPRFKFRFH